MGNTTSDKDNKDTPPQAKKQYKPPSFRHESVFEVSALACGKLEPTQSGCASSRKAS